MLEYKMKKAGINFYVQEESYTSKASALDGDDIPVFDELSAEERKKVKFSGHRVRRGLYRSADKTIINADINGAANQLRKYLKGVRDADYRPADRGLVMNPVQMKVLFQRIKPKAFLPAKSRKKQGTVVCAKNKSIKNLNITKQI